MSSHSGIAKSPTGMSMAYSALSSLSAAAAHACDETSTCTRDRDLLSPDHCLNEDVLDDLWGWFCAANTNGFDLQLVFVKMVNSIRKPYVNFISKNNKSTSTSAEVQSFIEQTSTTSTRIAVYEDAIAGDVVSDINSQLLRQPSTASVYHIQSQSIVPENVSSHCKHNDDPGTNTPAPRKESPIDHKGQVTLLNARDSMLIKKLQDTRDSLTSMREKFEKISVAWPAAAALIPSTSPVRVVIKSAYWGKCYLRMNGSDVTAYSSGGEGNVTIQQYISGPETFELILHPELGSGVVSFKSTCFDNVFLRAEAQGVVSGPKHRIGLISCEYGCTQLTKFRLVRMDNQGAVAIESLAFPGGFLRLDGSIQGPGDVTLQDFVGGLEKFYILVVP